MELYLIRHPRPQVAPGVCYGQTDLGLAEPAAEVAERLRPLLPAGFALHTRLATEANSRIAHLVARNEVKAEVNDVYIREGKDVLEFSVRSTTKGEAVEHLRQYTQADAVFYAGDDVTDEDAFAALSADDVGLKSGTGATLANFRVPGPTQVARALALLADFREGDVHEQ